MQAIRVERRHVEQLIEAVQGEIPNDTLGRFCHPVAEDEVRQALEDVVTGEILGGIMDEHSPLRTRIVNSLRRRLG